jgi:16S rRNA (cytosine967-C5)-methyltransferase
VVQDYSSQQIKKFLQVIKPGTGCPRLNDSVGSRKPETRVWDCCAGSGGKSILAYDVLENIQLTATDVRSSIIHNLQQRFKKAGIKNYKSFVLDLTMPFSRALSPGGGEGFDLIICDTPCTGSGTWSRTPEQLFFFQSKKIDEYSSLQKKIVSNAIPYLKAGGHFLYITCSVFEKENEAIAAFIKKQFHLKLIKMELIKGYDKKADTMFAALFQS